MFRNMIFAAMGMCLAGMLDSAKAQEQPTPPQAASDVEQEGMEVLTRGPVHEAFAEPVTLDPNEKAMVVQQQPPEPVDEIPPDARPEDAAAVWIPGYWQWDDVENRYLWVSGVWRVPPSGQRFVPGYWTESDGGYQRVSGFWTPVAEQQVQYLPEPPATLEVGPNTAAPSDNHFWIPGCWIYANQEFRWRPGYWYAVSPNWLWVPDRYVWTPRGYIFCNGYWDYPDWSRRGLLFAPVYFHRPIYRTAGFYFTPRVFINVNFLTNHFFCRPGYRHYYFGDFYGGPYLGRGFYHWHSWSRWGRGWDPYFNHFRWTHAKHNPRWHDHWRDRYDYYARHDRNRLPHTWKEARDWERRDGDRREWDRERFVGTTVEDALRRRDGRSPHQLARLNDEERSRYRANARELRDLARERGDVERGAEREGRRLGQTAGRDDRRGSFRLPDSEQFRRSAMRDQDGRVRRIEPGLTREGQRPDRQEQFERLREQRMARGERDAQERVWAQPGPRRETIDGARQADERSRGPRFEGTPRQFDSRRFENLPRADREGERSVLERRSVGRVPVDTPQVSPTPRRLEGQRQLGAPRGGFDGRQRFERSPSQPNFDSGRRVVPQSGEIRRGEGAVNPGFRFDSPSRRQDSGFRSREGGPAPNFERRSWSPPSPGPSRQQFSRPQGSSRVEAAPRGGGVRIEGRSSGGENRSFRSSGGGDRSFRSGGSPSRGGSPAVSRGGGGGGKGKRGKD